MSEEQEVKTKQDLENDLVGLVYGAVSAFKTLVWVALFFIAWFFIYMFAVTH